MAPFKELGSKILGTGPYEITKNERPYDLVVMWPNPFHPLESQLTSLRFVTESSESEEIKKYPVDLIFKTTNEKSTRCSVNNPDRRCLRLYFDFPTEKAGWTAEFETKKISPDKVAWSQNPEQFYHFATRDKIKIDPLKKSKNYGQ